MWLQPPPENPCSDKGTAPGKRIAVIIWANEQDHVPRMVREKNPGMRHLFSKVAVNSFTQKPSDLGNMKGVSCNLDVKGCSDRFDLAMIPKL